MAIRPIVEFRDPDGTYVLVKPMDEVRGIVLNGTHHRRGQVIRKSSHLSWGASVQDIGGATRLSPEDLVPLESENALDYPLPESMDDEEEIFESAHKDVETRSSGSAVQIPAGSGTDPDIRALIRRLVTHYRREHEIGSGRLRRIEPCRCPQHAPGEDTTLAWFHKLVAAAVFQRKVQPLFERLRRIDRGADQTRTSGRRKLRSA
jgi:hypothetical protein